MSEEGLDQSGAEDAVRQALEGEESGSGSKTFSQEYVHDLREEAGRWRVQAQQAQALKTGFDGVSDQDLRVWQEMARITAQDPVKGAEYMKAVSKELLKQHRPADAPQGQASGLTQADVDRLVNERIQQSQQQQLIHEIEREAEGLGYKLGSQDYVDLLWVAEHETNADLKAADKKLQERREAWVEQELERRRTQGWPKVVRGGSGAAEKPKEIKTFEDARNAMNARLAMLPD